MASLHHPLVFLVLLLEAPWPALCVGGDTRLSAARTVRVLPTPSPSEAPLPRAPGTVLPTPDIPAVPGTPEFPRGLEAPAVPSPRETSYYLEAPVAPDNPVSPEAPVNSEALQFPIIPSAPNALDCLEVPEHPGIAAVKDTPESSKGADFPAASNTPVSLKVPDFPPASKAPNNLKSLQAPDNPAAPNAPESSEALKAPDTPAASNAPKTSKALRTPGIPNVPEISEVLETQRIPAPAGTQESCLDTLESTYIPAAPEVPGSVESLVGSGIPEAHSKAQAIPVVSNIRKIRQSDSRKAKSKLYAAAFSQRSRRSADGVEPSQLAHNMTSPTSGYVMSGHCLRVLHRNCHRDASYTVEVPDSHVVLVSFPVFELNWGWDSVVNGFVEFLAVFRNGLSRLIWRTKSTMAILPDVFRTSVRIRLYIPLTERLKTGFKMVYTIHPEILAPPKLGKGLFNCSVPFYDSFKEHFHCNMKVECPGGEDEGPHCPFSSSTCHGTVAVGNKCMFLVHSNTLLRWEGARRRCRKLGADLVTLKTEEEWNAFLLLCRRSNIVHSLFVGLHSYDPLSMPAIYKYSFLWVDGVVGYDIDTRVSKFGGLFGRLCFFYVPIAAYFYVDHLNFVSCEESALYDFVCEFRVRKDSPPSPVVFPLASGNFTWLPARQSLVKCPEGHMSHAFLSCDPDSRCGTDHHVSRCQVPGTDDPSVAVTFDLFPCGLRPATVPYTLVCDFRDDCGDGSDEAFCVFPAVCQGFQCNNGQCIVKDKQCDRTRDCWDGSDELCTFYFDIAIYKQFMQTRVPGPLVINFHNNSMTQEYLRRGRDCPDTHFRCPGYYCLPLHCRCNGVPDCLDKSDEATCSSVQCPGYYRCRGSSVCVHPSHLCDGWPQCPQHDDDWLCDAPCPQSCLCQGLAFRCERSFNYSSYSDLRYLDASGSEMDMGDMEGLDLLVWLNLADCELRRVARMELVNLRTLKLSGNLLESLDMDVFLVVRNLRELDLSHNPLTSLVSHPAPVAHPSLQLLDLTGVLLTTFNDSVLGNFPGLITLKLVHSAVRSISQVGFRPTPRLAYVNLEGSDIQDYPSDIFQTLRHLRSVRAQSYKLCCKELLPAGFDPRQCVSPRDEISSCGDLLRSDTYRAFLWIFSLLSLAGNVGCLVTRLFLMKSRSVTAFSLFVTNLGLADLLMGVYLGLVGVADHRYRGQYFWVEKTWKASLACQVAGFLSLLSSEMSAFIICLITLDRFLVLSSPFSEVRFKRRTAGATCLLVWLLGLTLAAVPLLPSTAEWHFYSQTGICIPLPITRKVFKGRNYAFGVIIVFNLLLFLLIATGQAMIYWTIRTTSMATSSTRKTKDLTIARRLFSVVVSDFLCWFPIGFLGVLAASGTPVPGEVNVGMAIFVLPLNAALNPFLYTSKVLTERWNRLREKQLLKQLQARCEDLGGK